ncbi:chromate transporter [Neobacillus niacini]|uniref:chromate transporter n=1 Tax=Neobacillus niacini TaxID=86668 RepID=UPI00052FBE2F|nr:chromate transporter [Neobacillus niacini]KGM45750.1 chromate transporter [Neobacillus niacini]MEC1523734.1 chromate transporter [Neobacillus niacini]
MVLLQLFQTFFIMGFVSFGGGYAMIPIIESAITKYGWMSSEQLTNIIAIAGMSPGPIAANSAILIGYTAAGISGAFVSTFAILFPSLILVICVAGFFVRLHHNPVVEKMFYGLKPLVTSLIIFAAIKFALANNLVSINLSFRSISLVIIFGLSLFALLKLRWNPVYVLLLSGLVGVTLYS